GTAVVALFERKLWPLLLLWTPAPFYMLSIAESGVPLFVPVWWPFSRYNVRYGIEMLPAFATFTAIGVYGLLRFVTSVKAKTATIAISLVFPAITYILIWRTGPESFQEAVLNSRTRVALESQLASEFENLSSNTKFLMYLGDHVGVFQQAGIPLA